jgi:hypothetical protein
MRLNRCAQDVCRWHTTGRARDADDRDLDDGPTSNDASLFQFEVAGSKVSTKGVLAVAGPCEVMGDLASGGAEGAAVEISDLHGGVDVGVVVERTDGYGDVAGLGIDIFVAGDGGQIEIGAGKADARSAALGTSTVALKLL